MGKGHLGRVEYDERERGEAEREAEGMRDIKGDKLEETG